MRAVYRADIDGLRALAVLGVVLFHFRLFGIDGGFVGVDVFFVISGYLITGMIAGEIERREFSFLQFYNRRIRRIFPALYVVLLATLAVGIAVLLPSDLLYLAKGEAATILFASNVFYWKTTTYFGHEQTLNAVLHTWSLAVEEQFYIVFPLFLILCYRFLRKHVRLVLAISAAASFAVCVAAQDKHATATFYLAPFRAWELMAGALLAVDAVRAPTVRWQRETIALVGLALIAYALRYTRPGVTFPGWEAAISVVGSALVIHAGRGGGSWVRRLLESRVLVYIGLISYSLYLWHWPILIFSSFLADWHLSIVARAALVLVAIGVSALSYHFVERPIRFARRDASPGRVVLVALLTSAIVMTAVVACIAERGLRARFPAAVDTLDEERAPTIPFIECADRLPGAGSFQELCTMGAKGTAPSFILWGDSHALSWYPAMNEVLRKHGVAAVFASLSSCPPLLGIVNPSQPDCRAYNDRIADALHASATVSNVIIVASWASYASDTGRYALEDAGGTVGNARVFAPALSATVARLLQDGKAVWLLGPTPHMPFDVPFAMAEATARGQPLPATGTRASLEEELAPFVDAVAALPESPRLFVSEPSQWLCGEAGCAYEQGGLPLYRDDGHLNVRGMSYLEPALDAEFTRFLQATAPADAAKP